MTLKASKQAQFIMIKYFRTLALLLCRSSEGALTSPRSPRGQLQKFEKPESESEALPSQQRVPRVAPRTGHVHQVLEQRPPLQLLSRFRCEFGSLSVASVSALGSSRELPDRQASGAGGGAGGGFLARCACRCAFSRRESRKETEGSRKDERDRSSLRLFRCDGG